MIATEEYKSQLYAEYYKKVLAYLNGRVNDYYLAEELASDVFLKVFEKLDKFDDTKASVSTWIFTITRNTLIDYFRTRRVHSEIPEDISTESDIEENYCKNEMLETLADALESLPERERDLIILHYYSGQTLKEVG
ncbi:MAG: RNA polymerase sigma factor, partial [Lachnospiraceae bacterium]|nr:RNA polymerase sigma factor [Candidatus Equihabitans merdae]